jgi:hypothetical protein
VSYRHRKPLGDETPGVAADEISPLAVATTNRGFVRVPTFDVRQYVHQTLLTLAIGFGVGVGIGALFGNVLTKANIKVPTAGRLIGNARGSRRTTARRRGRGRPTVGPAADDVLDVTIDGHPVEVQIRGGGVYSGGSGRLGSVYDLGTAFRAVPRGGEVRDFTTLAGAVKHIVRER